MDNKNKDAIEILKLYRKRLTESPSNQLTKDIEAFDIAIKSLENQKTGKWIYKKFRGCIKPHCSNCGYGLDVLYHYDYCPNCGAYMKGENK